MAEKSSPTFGGFEALSDMLIGKKGKTPIVDDGVDDNIPTVKPEDIVIDKVDDDVEDVQETIVTDEIEPVVSVDTDVDSFKEAEPEIVKFVAEQLATELNWDLGEEKFESISDVIDYMAAIVEENSKPQYATSEVEKFNTFVKDGGDLRGFYTDVYAGKVNPETVDLGSSENQRAIIREHLRNQGYKEERITRTVERYETAEVLEEEAVDALELVKEFNEKKEQKLLNDQKKLADDYRKQQQKFFSDVQESIKNINNIRGISVNEKQKVELLEYIFRPDNEGMTQYQKDYVSDIKNLLESAFLTKEGDKLFKKIEEKAQSEAYKNMKEKIAASKGKKNKTTSLSDGGSSAGLSILGNYLRKPS